MTGPGKRLRVLSLPERAPNDPLRVEVRALDCHSTLSCHEFEGQVFLRTRWMAVVCALLGTQAQAAGEPAPGSVNAQTVRLPDGPGSVRGLADSASVNVFSGQVGYGVPLDLPAGIAGFGPKLSLTYSGDLGNGPLGVGWTMPQVVLRRSVRLGVPAYTSADELELVGVGGGRLVALPDGTWRVEGQGHSVKVERDGTGYVITENGGVRYRMGVSAAGRQADGARVAAWHVEEVLHPNGQTTAFSYTQHNGQQYLADVRWGPNAAFRAEFVYGARPDPTVSYRTGFKVETAQRLTEVRVHSFGELLRAYVLGYEDTLALSRLKTVTQLGRGRVGALPTLTLTYATPQAAATAQVEPAGGWLLSNTGTALMDVDGDGLTDLVRLTSSGHQWRKGTGTGFAATRVLSGASGAQLSSSRFLDVDGDARPELVRNFSEAWQINRLQGESLGTTATKWTGTDGMPLYNDTTFFADLNGDGRVDVVRTGSESMSVRWNRATGLAASVQKPPVDGVSLLPGANTRFHDVNGDGLADVVQLSTNWFKVYLGKGDGTFVAGPLQNYPWGEGTTQANVKLADLNRDGLMDLVYVRNGYVSWYRGKAGGGTETAPTQLVPPGVDGASTVVALADLNGNGSEDVVWSGPDGMWALDLAGPTTAGMLLGIDNGLGKTVALQYQASAALAAEADGTPQAWTRRFPTSIPVPVRMTVNPGVGGPARVVEYTVRDGFWDATERRFGGFLVGGVRTVGSGPADTLYEETRYHEGTGMDRSLRGLALEVRREDGLHTLYAVATSVYESRPVQGLPDVPLLRKPALLEARTKHHEGLTTPLETLTTYAYDARVRPIEEKSFGRLDLTGDERTVQRGYASDDALMVQDVVCEETLMEADGTVRSSARMFYGDAAQVFSWTDPTQCRAGRLMRETHGLLAGEQPRWVLQSATEYDAWDNPTRRYGNGLWRAFTYDAHHLRPLTESMEPQAGRTLTWTSAWDDVLGAPQRVTSPDGVVTQMSYDSLGRPDAISVDGAPPHLRYAYDWTAPRPRTFTYVFDGDPSALAGSWTGGWSANGAWRESVSVSDGSGQSLYTATRLEAARWAVSGWRDRDTRGRTIFRSEPFYAQGALPTARPAGVVGQTLAYDAQNRLVSQWLPNGGLRTHGYKAFESTRTDTAMAPVLSRVDGQGRIIRTERQVGTALESVDAHYDAAGHILSLSLQDGVVTHAFTYDTLGRMVAAQDPDVGARTLEYDDRDRLVLQTNGANQGRTFAYDDANRLIRTVGEDATTLLYHYDEGADGTSSGHTAARLAWVEEPRGQVHFGYDAYGRRSLQRRTVDALQSEESVTYSASGLPLTQTTDGLEVPFGYDAAGRLVRAGTYWEALTLDASGLVLEERYGNGVRQVYARDAVGLVSRIQTLKSAGGALYDVTLTRNAYGAPVAVTDDDGVGLNHAATFAYDPAARLTDALLGAVKQSDGTLAAGPDTFHFSYAYDGLQNMVSRQSTGPHALALLQGSYTYGERGFGPRQLTSIGSGPNGTTLDYDGAGRMVRLGGRQMEYDGLDQLVRVTLPSVGSQPGVVEHAYGHDGVRIRTQDPTGQVQYAFSQRVLQRNGMRELLVTAGDRTMARVRYAPPTVPAGPLSGALSALPDARSLTTVVALGGVLALMGVTLASLRRRHEGPAPLVKVGAGALVLALTTSACEPALDLSRARSVPEALAAVESVLYFHSGVAAGPVLMTRQDGTVFEERRSEPFGTPVDAFRETATGASVGSADFRAEPINSLNKPTDPDTGWSDHGDRWMAPEVGLWLSPDPPVKAPQASFLAAPWDLHPYQYVRQNPVFYWDPDGWSSHQNPLATELKRPLTAGQVQIVTRSFAPFDTFGGAYLPGGYAGDGADRGFTPSPDVTAKMSLAVTIDTATGAKVFAEAWSDESEGSGLPARVFGRMSGYPLTEPLKGTARPTTRVDVTTEDGFVRLNQDMAAALPLNKFAADIDTHSYIQMFKDGNLLRLRGFMVGDAFPNAEIFIRDSANNRVMLHTFATPGGENGPYEYLGGDKRREMGSFAVQIQTNGKGEFTGVRAAGQESFMSVDDWNKQMTSSGGANTP